MNGQTIKLDLGTVYRKQDGGIWYFRYQINGQRKAVSLKTANREMALKKAKELQPTLQATDLEVISAHVKVARKLATKRQSILLSDAWDYYAKHPNRATPATVSEQLSYRSTFLEFVAFLNQPQLEFQEVENTHAEHYAAYLRNQPISVSTHNRKIKRLAKIFRTLEDYREGKNPFQSPALQRKEREEQSLTTGRRSFSREQEEALLATLDDPKLKLLNKSEIRMIYLLGMFTGQRLKDCVMLRWDRINFDLKRIWVKQFKTGKEVTIPIASQLLAGLEQALAWRVNDFVCPNVAERYNKVDANGKNVGNNLVNIDVLRVIRRIGLEPSVTVPGRKKKVTVYGFHSLRHSFASHCAEAGVPKAVVTSILGADSDIVDKYYTHIGNEAQEKAMRQLFGTPIGEKSAEEKIAAALAVIDALPEKNDIIRAIESALR